MKKAMIVPVLILLWILQIGVYAGNSAKQFSNNKTDTPARIILANIRYDADGNGSAEGWRRISLPGFLPEPASVLDTGDVVHTIPAPASRCQGLTYDGNSLWVSDYQTDLIYEVSPVDGTVLNSFASPGSYIEGLAWEGTYLWAADNGGGPGSSEMVYKIDPSSGATVDSFLAPNLWPHGITWDGQYLWMNDFAAKTIDKVDPATGQLISQLNAPGDHSIGLTWDGEYLWGNNFDTDSLYRIDPVTGTIAAQVVSPHTNPRDMAWDGQYVWVLSWLSATIYQVDVGAEPTSIGDEVKIPYKFQLSQNYPNPFNNSTMIRFDIAQKGYVTLIIYDILGRKVMTVLDETLLPGSHKIRFDAAGLSSGTYFYRLRAEEAVETKRMILLK
jgi:glutamine cyclotransferase